METKNLFKYGFIIALILLLIAIGIIFILNSTLKQEIQNNNNLFDEYNNSYNLVIDENSKLLQNNKELKHFYELNCLNLSNIDEINDIDKIREISLNYLVGIDKNINDVDIEEIYLYGNDCSFSWNIIMRFISKDSNNNPTLAVVYMVLNPITLEMQHYNVMYCDVYDGSSVSASKCSYQFMTEYTLGETKQELINNLGLKEK